jgi:predicted aspartyl protease
LYPYREDPYSTRLDQPIFRPFVEVSLAHAAETTTVLDGLVDTGADAILASDLLAEELGIDLSDNEGETSHGVGG